MTTEPSQNNHSFRFKWGSMELAVIGLPAVITVLVAIMVLGGLRYLGLL